MNLPSIAAAAAKFALVAVLVGCLSAPARAHFPWLEIDDQGRAVMFFGESIHDRAYNLPKAVAGAEVVAHAGDDEPAAVDLEAVEEDELIGRRSAKPLAEGAVLEATVPYGLYHGMLLTYYCKHLPGDDPSAWPQHGKLDALKLDAVPSLGDDGPQLTITWKGKPLEGASINVTDSNGDSQEATTDRDGVARLTKIAKGQVGAVINFTEETKGEFDGKPYTSAGHFGTLTFVNPKDVGEAAKPKPKKKQRPTAEDEGDAAASTEEGSDDETASAYPLLDKPVSSFGGAVAHGYLYVYSGHTGREHAHSRDNLSGSFQRIKLDGGTEWETLAMGTPLQGLPLVAHDGKLYRVGGLSARNAAKEDEDIHSVDEFAVYDPATNQWTALAPLPERRSSHDAVVIGDKLYVVGGWTLSGDRAGQWLDTAWSFDLTKPNGTWEPLPSPTFKRRALAVAHWNGKLIALGGMDEEVAICSDVFALDLDKGEWTKLADLPSEGDMAGFGVSAWNLRGKLYHSGTEDSLYRLADDGQSWESAGELAKPRFFHRLLPGGDDALLSVAGASMTGHLASIEKIKLQ
jgi:N-acetylneuraminic acid mutarotase